MRFREGNETRVHRVVCPGGGPFRGARCRVCRTHSFPQGGCLRRNLITVFCDVNNPPSIFFRAPGPAPGAIACVDGARGADAARDDRARIVVAASFAKNILICSSCSKNARRVAGMRRAHARACTQASTRCPRGRVDGPSRRAEKKFSRSCVAPPDLRGTAQAPETNPAARGGRIEVPRRARRTHVAIASVVFVLEQFGVVVRAEQFVELLGFLGFDRRRSSRRRRRPR